MDFPWQQKQPKTNRLALVVEDNLDIQVLTEEILKGQGWEVCTASDGPEGLRTAQQRLPALILLDVMMPLLDGLRVLSALKRDAKTKDIPVVMMTSQGRGKDLEDAFASGAADYIVKPFDSKNLIAKTKKYLAPFRP